MRFSDFKKLFKQAYSGYTVLANDARFYPLTEAVTAGTTATTAPAGSLAVTSNATGKGKLFQSNGSVWMDAGKGYAVYAAIVAQAGTAAQTATVLENSLGGAVTLARSGVGVYTFTRTGAFTAAKTHITATVDAGATAVIVRVAHTSANVVTVSTFTEAGAAADLVGNVFLEIKVYP
jgi:hypothetical protein